MLINLYSLLSNTFYLPILLFFLVRFLLSKETFLSLKEKFGFYIRPRPDGKIIWINAVSIGESLSVFSIIKKILLKYPNHKILLTTSTLTSAKIIKERFPKDIIHKFTPIDIQFVVKKFFKYWKPDIGFFLESEFWPNLLSYSRKENIKLISLNSRISEKTFHNWLRIPNTAKKLLNSFSLFFAQDKLSENRLKKLGVKKIFNHGNIKFLSEQLPFNIQDYNVFKKYLKNRSVILLASSHPGEEKFVYKEFELLRKKQKNLFLILAPRHAHRSNNLEKFLRSQNSNFTIKSKENYNYKNTNCLIVDTFGELGLFYKLSDIVIIGGSFVPHGGQNPIEASYFNCCVIIGPYYENFFEIIKKFKKHNAIMQINSFNQLSVVLKKLLSEHNLREKLKKNIFSASVTEKKRVNKIWSKINTIINEL